MSDPPILFEREGSVGFLTVNRPEVLNALDRATLEALRGVIDEAATGTLRCIIVSGAGDRAFVAGADIAAMAPMTRAQAAEFARLGQAAFAALERLPMPTIAAVNGFALGGGCELALACDFIYATDKAKFGQPEVKLGILPGFGGTQRLPRRVGLGMARELIYTGRTIGAQEALRIGLVNAVVPRPELQERTRAVAAAIAACGPSAIAAAKRVIRDGADRDLSDAIELEARAFCARFESAEQREGMSAFLERRPPEFEDREPEDR